MVSQTSGQHAGRPARGEERRFLGGVASHRRDPQAVVVEERADVGRSDRRDGVPLVVEDMVQPVGRGTCTFERTASRTVNVWWLTPRCRSRVSPSEMRTQTIGSPPSHGDGVERGRHLERRGAEPRAGADHPRAHPHDDDVGAEDVPGHGQRRRHVHRLEVAAERVAGGDRAAQEPGVAQAGDQVATGRAAGRRRRS